MNQPRSFALVVLVALQVGSQPTAARAGEVPELLSWRCSQQTDPAFHVLCVPELVGAAPASMLERSGDVAIEPRARSDGPELRPVAERGTAEVMSAEAWRVPLHAPPTDSARVSQLMRLVLCGERPLCSVKYSGLGVIAALR